MSDVERRVLFDALAMVRPQVRPPIDPGPSGVQVKTNPVDGIRAQMKAHVVPDGWERDLREFSPITTYTSHLRFGWLEGSVKKPIQRWVLYECVPIELIPDEMRRMLGGKPWWELPYGLREGRKHMVSAYQWELYRQHRIWARPFWCLQGESGGTPARYSDVEERLLKLKQMPADPPGPGTLPFATWDGRVLQAVKQRDRLWKLGSSISRLKKSGSSHKMKAEAAAIEKRFRTEFLAWMEERFAPQADFLTHYTRKTESDRVLRQTTPGEEAAAAQMHDHFIEHGVMPYAADSPDN